MTSRETVGIYVSVGGGKSRLRKPNGFAKDSRRDWKP